MPSLVGSEMCIRDRCYICIPVYILYKEREKEKRSRLVPNVVATTVAQMLQKTEEEREKKSRKVASSEKRDREREEKPAGDKNERSSDLRPGEKVLSAQLPPSSGNVRYCRQTYTLHCPRTLINDLEK